jgi:hypothetical protein
MNRDWLGRPLLPPGHGGYRALPEDKGKPDTRKPPPPPPRPSKGGATSAK